jgi:carboxymethylenebutenolidase
MGERVTLAASDGFRLGAYRADPEGPARGAVAVIQEIFGVNHYIRAVCDRLAGQGFTALAPALFDRKVRDFESGYSDEERASALSFLKDFDWSAALRDAEAAVVELRCSTSAPAVIGFCLGGSLAFLAATRLDGLSASICFYGGQIVRSADEKPRCPTQMHFGDEDQSIPLRDVEKIKAKRPDCDIHLYHGGHGFACDERASYEPKSAALAWERSTEWLVAAFSQAGGRSS